MKKKFLKFSALVFSVVLCSSNLTAFASNQETLGSESQMELVTYNYVTKQEAKQTLQRDQYKTALKTDMAEMNLSESNITPAYNPGISTESDEISPMTADDWNHRRRVNPNTYPYTAVLALRLGEDTNGNGIADSFAFGTGFLEGYDVMATAGHCFWTGRKWIDECRIYVRQNSNTYGSTFYWPSDWVMASNYTSTQDYRYDWCVVTLQNNLGSANGWFGKGWSSGDISNTNVTVSGYPVGDAAHSGWTGFQYMHSGRITSSTWDSCWYNIETSGGQSGGPVYDSNFTVWAIHTYGAGSEVNQGNRITEWLYDILQAKFLEGKQRYG